MITVSVDFLTAYNGHTDCLRLLLQYSNTEDSLDCTDVDSRCVSLLFSSTIVGQVYINIQNLSEQYRHTNNNYGSN